MASFLNKIGKVLQNLGPKIITTVNISQISNGSILKDKTIVITGGGRGIGYAIAEKCIAEGAVVIISGRNETVLKQAVKKLGDHCYYVVYDVSDVENAQNFLLKCKEVAKSTINCVVCNAGVSLHEGNFSNVTIEGFEQQFNTNFKAGYFLGKAFIEMKIEEHEGDAEYLVISSETGDMAYDIPYGMTKAALNSMVGGLSRRVYQYGIRVNALAPGLTKTDMTASKDEEMNNLTVKNQASGRKFLPEEVAEVACFLLSDASKCISGEIIHCNAGNHKRINF